MTRQLLFENGTCSRCGGSGHYSYCMSYGTKCFKCHGDGVTLTKRGAAAQAWFTAQKKKLASEVKVGDRIVVDGVPGFSKSEVVTVDFVGFKDDGTKFKGADGEWKSFFVVEGTTAKGEKSGIHGFENTEIKMHLWGEAKAALIAEALAFQSTLTKSGTVMKKAAAKAA